MKLYKLWSTSGVDLDLPAFILLYIKYKLTHYSVLILTVALFDTMLLVYVSEKEQVN